MSVNTKLEYLSDTKDYIRQCIQQKGVTVPASNTFHDYGDRILEIETEQHEGEGDGEGQLLEMGTAIPTGQDYLLEPPEDYLGFRAVTVVGDSNLIPENIAEGITIYGVTGTKELSGNITAMSPTYETYFEHAKTLYDGPYEHLMVLETDDVIAYGFMLSNFSVTSYDSANTEFYASGWVYVAYNKKNETWKVEPWENSTSNGNSYIKNIRYCDTYLYYNNLMIYPKVMTTDYFAYEIVVPKAGLYDIRLAGSGQVKINWGDGVNDVYELSSTLRYYYHIYTEPYTTYTITLLGDISRMKFPSIVTRVLTNLPRNITTCNEMFYNSSIMYVPDDLFAACKNITNMDKMFYNCRDLKNFPYFYKDTTSPNGTSFYYMCSESDNIQTFPPNIFDMIQNPTDITGMLNNCTDIKNEVIPSIWDENLYGTKYTGIPHTGCFGNLWLGNRLPYSSEWMTRLDPL